MTRRELMRDHVFSHERITSQFHPPKSDVMHVLSHERVSFTSQFHPRNSDAMFSPIEKWHHILTYERVPSRFRPLKRDIIFWPTKEWHHVFAHQRVMPWWVHSEGMQPIDWQRVGLTQIIHFVLSSHFVPKASSWQSVSKRRIGPNSVGFAQSHLCNNK